MKQTGPIFIVGAPRSGTTMLQYRLRNHPEISLPTGESHFIVPLCMNQASFVDLTRTDNIRAVLQAMYRQNRNFLETDLHGVAFDIDKLAEAFHAEGRHTVPAIIGGLFEKNARAESKSRWGDKTPYYVMHTDKILEWFPDAQIVHLIRDGRDVALSLFRRRHDFMVYNTYYAAEYWESFVAKGRALGRQLPPDKYMELRFEDILASPREMLEKLCEFLTVEFTEALFDIQPSEKKSKTPLVHQPLKVDNAGKWHVQMTPSQVHAFERVAGETLEACGYERATQLGPPSIPLKASYRLHNRLLTAYHKIIRSKHK